MILWQLQRNYHQDPGDVRYTVIPKKSPYLTEAPNKKESINLSPVQTQARKENESVNRKRLHGRLTRRMMLFVGNNVSVANMTLRDACERYIIDRTSILSPGTIREYKRSVKKDMQNIMLINLFDLTQGDIQEELNRESQTHSPKYMYQQTKKSKRS